MLTALYTILVFCLIIAVHEFGHFVAAKLSGITVHEFSIGMGKRLCGFRKNETDYNLRLFPIGGYVKLEGEDSESEDPNAFGNKSALKRLFVLVSGAFMNFVLGFLIFLILSSFSTGFYSNEIGNVIKGSAFEKAGIYPGDRIISMEGKNSKVKIHDYNDFSYYSYKNGNGEATVVLERDDEIIKKKVKPVYMESEKRVLFGFSLKVVEPTFSRVIVSAFRQSIFVVKLVIVSFVDMIKGSISVANLSGPVGIVNEIGSAAKSGFLDVLYLAALISMNLGVVNLLPLPALDGGRVVFVVLELLRGKPIDRDKEGIVHFIGFALLILLMLVITYSDILKLV